MAHIQVEASVRTHKKFLKAGPAASWLWLCSVGYCQDGLTDGFIPSEALPYLGVKAPAAFKDRLVQVGLWDAVPGGWKIHDYAQHNRTAAQIQDIRNKRAKGGSLGGRPLNETLPQTLEVTDEVNLTKNPSHLISDTASTTTSATSHLTKPARETEPLDVPFSAFREKYPAGRRKGGLLIEQAFMAQSVKAGGSAALMAALENHLISEQWQSSQHIPGMDVWLNEERWRQILEPPSTKPAGAYANWKPR